MSTTPSKATPISPSATSEFPGNTEDSAGMRFPIETDILITVNGDVIIADLPEELQALLLRLRVPAAQSAEPIHENKLD